MPCRKIYSSTDAGTRYFIDLPDFTQRLISVEDISRPIILEKAINDEFLSL
jgi:hypothetical protein